jgi:putative Ca2+/H+ antiporter (TMEM165/GDT1 family)
MPFDNLWDGWLWLQSLVDQSIVQRWPATAGTAFLLIAAAEIGDKSQLVCMTLAARYRAGPVLLGAVLAFAVLNLAAVVFGAMVAAWLPEQWVAAGVAGLFAVFGLHALLAGGEEETENIQAEPSHHALWLTTFLLIVLAEFGDKTQLAVAGFSSTAPAVPVWLGSTLALVFTSALGVWAGRTVLQRLPMHWLHRFSGVVFLALAAVAAYRAMPQSWVDIAASWWDLLWNGLAG